MMTVLAIGALVVFGVLEYIRALSFQAIGGALVRRLNMPVLAAAVQASVDQGLSRATQSLRDIAELRSFLTSSAVSAPLDAAWSPIFLGALFLLHPLFGLLASATRQEHSRPATFTICCRTRSDTSQKITCVPTIRP